MTATAKPRHLAALGAASALLALPLAGTADVAPAEATGPGVRDCNHFVYYPNIKVSSSRNLSCRGAVRVLRRYDGVLKSRFNVSGYRCKQVSGGEFGGQWRCTKGHRAFRFEAGD